MGELVQRDGFSSMDTQTVAIKLAMAVTYDWWHQFPPLLGYWFYMVRMCWVLDNKVIAFMVAYLER